MGVFFWDDDKNAVLKKTRGVSFEDIVLCIENGHLLDVLEHPNRSRYPTQWVYVVEVKGYVYLVPFIKDKLGHFLKTIFPSRKYTQLYLERE